MSKRQNGETAQCFEDQSEVVAFLSDPSCHGAHIDNVDRIDTHGALIFLAGDRAYKLKRAVKLPYLDFSTVSKRGIACNHEMERNKAAAPGLYIAARPVVRAPSGRLILAVTNDLTETDHVVDWVVEMHRFDQDDLFDNLAKQGGLSPELATRLADQIAEHHAEAASHREVDGKDIVARVAAQTLLTFFEAGGPLLLQNVEAYSSSVVAEVNAQTPLLRARAHNGHVRLCHGDLHLRNIVLHQGRPTLFDAIEFDDSIATIDVFYDIAFLIMDLWHRDLRQHANTCFNAYVSKAVPTDDLDGLGALPLFLSIRAAVRAMVAIDKARVEGLGPNAAGADEVKEYFLLARQFLEPVKPVLIAVGGFSGTGKSTLSAALAPEIGRAPGALHLRSDVERKRLAGVDPLDRLAPNAYSESTSRKVYKRLADRAELAILAGQSVIVDAAFLENDRRSQLADVAARVNVPFIGFWLDAGEEELIKRVNQRRNDASDANEDVVRQQSKARDRINQQLDDTWHRLDAGGNLEAVLARARRILCAPPGSTHSDAGR